jgi:hypothetical protein
MLGWPRHNPAVQAGDGGGDPARPRRPNTCRPESAFPAGRLPYQSGTMVR